MDQINLSSLLSLLFAHNISYIPELILSNNFKKKISKYFLIK